jgi:hypothetical protein
MYTHFFLLFWVLVYSCSAGGNELITDLSAAHTDYELTHEQLFRACYLWYSLGIL